MAQQRLSDSALQATFARWSAEHRVVGLAIGRMDENTRSIVTGGVTRAGGSERITDSTEFEIGSITKAFTGTVLADMVLKHEVALDDPVAKYLPGWTIPSFEGRAITLLDLATHSSGLPRDPSNLNPRDPSDPLAEYDDARMMAFLRDHTLRRSPGTAYEYSNLGMSLLGIALAKRAGTTYEELLRARILDPLGMNDTRITMTASQEARFATGHDASFTPTKPWHLLSYTPAGGLHSTVLDLFKLANAVRDTTQGPLAMAMAFAIRPRRPYSGADSIGLAWHHLHPDGVDVVWHNGGTSGFRTFLGVDISHNRAAIAMTNAGVFPADGVGISLLGAGPLIDPPSTDPPKELALPAEALAKFVGRYEMTPQFAIDMTQDGAALFLQATGQPRYQVFAKAPREFFLKVVKAEILFQVDTTGAVTGLVLNQNGASQLARKVR